LRTVTTRRRPLLRRLRIGFLPVPSQAAGLAAVVAVLGAAVVSVPLVTAAAQEGAWSTEAARQDALELGVTLATSTLPEREQPRPGRFAQADPLDEAVARAADDVGLAEPVFQARSRSPLFALTPDGFVRTQLLFRTGAFDHVEIVEGAATDDGVLVPQRLADRLGVGPGDVLDIESDAGLLTTLPVSGIYADPTAPLPAFWAGERALLLPRPDADTGDPIFPAPVVLASRDLTIATAQALQQDLFLSWFLPVDPAVPVDEARATEARIADLQAAIVDPGTPLGRILNTENFPRPVPRTALPDLLDAADRTARLVAPPVRAVGLGAGAAALVLVGAWAALRVRRRRDEVAALVTRGLSPARGAGQAAREALLPLAVGTATGGAAGWLLVTTLGPADRFPAGTLERASVALGAAALAALVVLTVITAALVARQGQISAGPITGWFDRLPWLAVTTAVTVVAAVPVLTGDPPPDGGIDLLTLVVPLLVTVVAAGGLTALLPLVGRRADGALRRLPVAPFLALHRVVANRGAARLVVVTTALSLGLVVYAGALADSSDRTVAATRAVAAPADVVVPLVRRAVEDPPLPPGTTIVGIEQGVTLTPGGTEADLLALHPDAFADVAGWDPALADRPPAELLHLLATADTRATPVLVAGDSALVPGDERTLTFFSFYTLTVEVVGRADAFPGQPSHTPLLVAAWDRVIPALEATDRDPTRVFDRQVWANGDRAAVLDALATAGYAFEESEVSTGGGFAARPEVRAQEWSLGYLRAVSLAAGALGALGLVLHALAQQRRRTVAALLLGRMGLSRRAGDAAAGLEIALLTGVGALVAVGVALPASALVLRLLDPVPDLPPEALFAVPWGSLAAVAAGVVALTAVGAVLVGRPSGRTEPGEVLREAG
jgi:hypothetical protein